MLRKPKSIEELSYFTRRSLPNGGKVTVWVFKGEDIANIEYICPYCGYSGQKQKKFERVSVYRKIEGKRKKVQVFKFNCDKCGKEIELEKWTRRIGRK